MDVPSAIVREHGETDAPKKKLENMNVPHGGEGKNNIIIKESVKKKSS